MMDIPILKVGIHREGLLAVDEASLDSIVANSHLPLPFRDRDGRDLGWVTRLWRDGDTLYGEVDHVVVSASVWPAEKKVDEVRMFPRSLSDPGDKGRM